MPPNAIRDVVPGLPMSVCISKRPLSLLSIAWLALTGAFGCAAREAQLAPPPEPVAENEPVVEASAEPAAVPEADANRLARRLTPEEIQTVVRGSFEEFRACYQAGLLLDPKLTGYVTVHFVIGENGKVKEAELVTEGERPTSLPNEQVTSCMLDTYRKLEFPAFKGGEMSIVYPIRFAPEE